MKPLLLVTKQGVYGSLQDKGRYGYRAFGIPLSGPMDHLSFQAAQRILHHYHEQTSFEMFVGGFEFEALADGVYVLTVDIVHAWLIMYQLKCGKHSI